MIVLLSSKKKPKKKLTLWNRVLLEKLTVPQLVRFPVFDGTRTFLTVCKSLPHVPILSHKK
jgi:hypothetical protein